MFKKMNYFLQKIKNERPLILNLTNYVTMDFMANCLLALGAAPIMSEDEREFEQLITIANAINLNLGTFNEKFIQQAAKAIYYAKSKNKPIVLDPVGAGASHIRTQTSLSFLTRCSIVRGNASEIIALQMNTRSHGVESMSSAVHKILW
jgi:hydroxyethylthiazole kinase